MSDTGARARGRSRARAAGQPPQTRRPGGQEVQGQAAAPAIGRGRVARGGGPAAGEHVPALADAGAQTRSVQVAVPPTVAATTGAISRMAISSGDNGARGGGRGTTRGRRGEVEVRTRPTHVVDKRGEGGTPIILLANYFKIESAPSWVIFQYHVDFLPEIDTQRGRRELLRVHANLLGVYLFDGMGLYATRRLPNDENELFSERSSDGARIMIKIKLIREIPPNDPIVMQILSIQMRKNFRHLNFKLLGRQYYDPQAQVSIREHNLELWPGYITAIHQHEEAPLLCADLTFKVLRTDTVLDQLGEICRNNRNRYQDEAVKQLVGSIVLTRYNNKTYLVDDIDWSTNPRSTFTLRDGSTISFIDYYYNTYQIKIRDANQPMLLSNPRRRDALRGNTGPIILIPELCTMTGISEETRTNYRIMKAIGESTRAPPASRVQCIRMFLDRINSNETIANEMRNWNLSFSSNLVEVRGRTLPTERLYQGDQANYSYNPKTADWTKEMRSAKLFAAFSLRNWLVITNPRDSENAQGFLSALSRVSGPMGMRIDRPRVIRLQGDRPGDYLEELRKQDIRELEFVMFVFPNNKKDRYDAIKKHCCISNPIPSQVMLGKTIMKPGMHMSVATKVAIQINCKLGGAPWCIPIPMRNAMVIGYDSYHDSSMRGRSVGAVCCSLDKDFTRYHSRVQFQTSHQDLLDGLFANITAGLRRYQELNKTLPEKIFIYRDGVGEGQLRTIKDFEVEHVLQCFKQIHNYQPKVVFIIVTKRLNTRLFLKSNGQVDNPLPGTVVDTVITRPDFYDFFLVSQSVNQGSVSPTHYNVIYDTVQLRPDLIQKLTYKLTHLYYNWPGTLRVPAPCMYAHKLAFLTGQSLHSMPNQALADTLYYL